MTFIKDCSVVASDSCGAAECRERTTFLTDPPLLLPEPEIVCLQCESSQPLRQPCPQPSGILPTKPPAHSNYCILCIASRAIPASPLSTYRDNILSITDTVFLV